MSLIANENLWSFLRLLLLWSASAGYHVSSTPPNPSGEGDAVLKRIGSDEGAEVVEKDEFHDPPFVLSAGLAAVSITKGIVWTVTTAETVSRLLSLDQTSAVSTKLLPFVSPALRTNVAPFSFPPATSPPYTPLLTAPSPLFLLSTLAVYAGTRIRSACYNALGPLYTFRHTTRPQHRLITAGPYSIVRHPAYVGRALGNAGILGMLLDRGSWLRQAGLWPAWPLWSPGEAVGEGALGVGVVVAARVALAVIVAWMVLEVPALLVRAPREDAILRRRFGEEWEAYRRRVPWLFIPHVV